jgi:hypothetical protein
MRWFFIFSLVFLFFLFVGVELQEQNLTQKYNQQMQINQDLERRLEKVENLEPDIGDYMKDLQFDMGKLWYAEKFKNKGLALYEIKEMQETIQGIGTLNPVIHHVNVSGVLEALKNTQIEGMKNAIEKGDEKAFQYQYQQTLLTCNQCHEAVGNKFIQITIPSSPPVSNQHWKP